MISVLLEQYRKSQLEDSQTNQKIVHPVCFNSPLRCSDLWCAQRCSGGWDADVPENRSFLFGSCLSCFRYSMPKANLSIRRFPRAIRNASCVLAAIHLLLTFFVLLRCCVCRNAGCSSTSERRVCYTLMSSMVDGICNKAYCLRCCFDVCLLWKLKAVQVLSPAYLLVPARSEFPA